MASGKNETGEYAIFSNALKQVLSVSHSEMKTKLAAEKQARQKQRVSSRASRDKGWNAVPPTLPVTSAKVNRFPATCDKARSKTLRIRQFLAIFALVIVTERLLIHIAI